MYTLIFTAGCRLHREALLTSGAGYLLAYFDKCLRTAVTD